MYIYHNRTKDEYKAFKSLRDLAEYSGISYNTLQKHFLNSVRYDKNGITIHKDK